MGGGYSKKPIDLMTKHFAEAFDTTVCNSELLKYKCSIAWPKMTANWPGEGSFYGPAISHLQDVMMEKGDPDDFPYVEGWRKISDNPPKWAKKHVERAALVMVAQLKSSKKKSQTTTSHAETKEAKLPILECPSEEQPPPYVCARTRAPTAPVADPPETTPVTQSLQAPQPRAEFLIPVPSLRSPELLPATPPVLEAVTLKTPNVATSRAPDTAQLETPLPENLAPKQLYPMLNEDIPSSTDPVVNSPGLDDLRKSVRLIEKELKKRKVTESQEAEVSKTLPIRTAPALVPAEEQPDPNRTRYTTVNTYTYVPFSSSDLLNWKNHGPSYESEPEQFVDMIEGVISAHNPTWSDIQQLMGYLLTTEQRMQIQANLEEAALKVAKQEGAGADAHAYFLARFAPTVDPKWDIQKGMDRNALRRYQDDFIQAVKKGRKRMMNMQKIHNVVQEKDESPGAFLERLMKAYRRYTPIDPEDEKNRQTVAMVYVSQSAPDIRRKLQKAEGFEGMSLTQLKALADKVFLNRDVEEKKEQTKRMKEKASLLAAALHPQNPFPADQRSQQHPPLGRNQCAFCKSMGHWKRECPSLMQNTERRRGNRGNRGDGSFRGRGRGRGRGNLNFQAPTFQPSAQQFQSPSLPPPQPAGAMAIESYFTEN